MIQQQTGCAEYRGLTRRGFLSGSAAAGLGALAGTAALPRIARGAGSASGPVTCACAPGPQGMEFMTRRPIAATIPLSLG